MAKLTRKRIERKKSKATSKKSHIQWDQGGLPNFGIRFYPPPSKTRSYVIRYQSSKTGKPTIYTMGRLEEFKSIEEARENARSILQKIRIGRFPAQEKINQKANSLFFRETFYRYLEEHHASLSASSTYRNAKNRFELYLKPRFFGRKVSGITKEDLEKLHEEIGNKNGNPIQANRVIELYSRFINWLKNQRILEKSFENPTTGIVLFEENQRNRPLKRDEFACFIKAVKTEPQIDLQTLFLIALLSGCRISEIVSLRWEWIHWEEGCFETLDLKKRKNPRKRKKIKVDGEKKEFEKPRKTIPLTPLIQNLLLELYKNRNWESLWIFPQPKDPSKHRISYKEAWKRIKKHMPLSMQNLRVHDLRHTVSTYIGNHNVFLAQQILGHKDIRTTLRYTHGLTDEVKKIAEAYTKQFNPYFESKMKHLN